MDAPETKLLELLDGILEGSATDAEREEFTLLSKEHKELASLIAKQLRMHNLLQWNLEDKKFQELHRYLHPGSKIPWPLVGLVPEIARMTISRWKWAAAAVVLMGICGWIWNQCHKANWDNGILGEVASAGPINWTKNSTALVNSNRQIRPGRLETKCGTVTLRFRNGATLLVSGDFSMAIESDTLVRLEHGQATAHVPEQAHGFTVKTLDAEVVDLGTDFGVMARAGGTTDVVVFEGKVDLKPTTVLDAPQIRLTQGDGARVNRKGAISRIVEVHRDSMGSRWSTDQPGINSLFESVSDNVQPEEDAKFYEIVPKGLADDMKAYVDRPHEWNGLTSAGLPAFLVGADYIRTFNDYRYLSELEIQVQLARPAIVYIFFDHRVPPPDWLKEQFENIGVDIGLDEGPSEGQPTHTVGVGGGQSIDNIFSVWRRVCHRPEKLKFGPMGEKAGARAMYGIAATALD